jgi:hypothetical protein
MGLSSPFIMCDNTAESPVGPASVASGTGYFGLNGVNICSLVISSFIRLKGALHSLLHLNLISFLKS